MHEKVLRYLTTTLSIIYVPSYYQYVRGDDKTWWNRQLLAFPEDFQIPCNALITDRIPPFPKAVRDTIIDLYCPTSLKALLKTSDSDQDCLIRPYLGRRRRPVTQSRFQTFSLRNHSLHMDQIEDLELDGAVYGRIMAETLAKICWKAHIDANDLEFVLAPQRTDVSNYAEINDVAFDSAILGKHVLWMLDFDCCRDMPFDKKGWEQAVAAFYRNDPSYPRPGRDNINDQMLWGEFKDQFLETSEMILGQTTSKARLPALWVDLVEQRGQLRSSLAEE